GTTLSPAAEETAGKARIATTATAAATQAWPVRSATPALRRAGDSATSASPLFTQKRAPRRFRRFQTVSPGDFAVKTSGRCVLLPSLRCTGISSHFARLAARLAVVERSSRD